jgi:hypothetical protein
MPVASQPTGTWCVWHVLSDQYMLNRARHQLSILGVLRCGPHVYRPRRTCMLGNLHEALQILPALRSDRNALFTDAVRRANYVVVVVQLFIP